VREPQHISISPFLLLEAVRDGRLKNQRDVTNLRHEGWLHAQPYFECSRAFSGFQELGLIAVDENGDIHLTSKVERLLETFGFGPSQMSAYGRESLVVNPVFGRPRPASASPEIFVLMPLKAELRSIYDNNIRRVADSYGLSIARADDFFSASAIIDEIWSAINAAKIVIADCTGKNPNVFYEIGIAHTLEKPVISMSQTLADVPFDVAHRRAIVYENTPRGRKKLEEELNKALETELARANPVEVANDIT
jgi:hypothetical protein